MKKWLLFFLLSSLFSLTAVAQEEVFGDEQTTETSAPATTTKPATTRFRSQASWGLSLSTLQWDDRLRIQQGINNVIDVANFNAVTVTLQREFTHQHWGWSAGAFIGSGRANGGGNSSLIAYEKSMVAFTTFGVSPRVFYRLSGRINAGLTGMVFFKSMDWPKDASNQTVDAGRNLNVTGLADLNIRLFQKWDFYSGIGPLSEGATIWKIGMNYRF